MKKGCLALVFLFVFGALAFGQEHEEVDYLLFSPDSSNEFVDQDHARTQLDRLARYIRERELTSGQVSVFGYAATADNDIDPLVLSRDRASFVISELVRRGVPGHLFVDPVGHGEVDTWGDNEDETDRGLNRRVRILVAGSIVTPAVVEAAEPVVQPPAPVVQEPEESGSKFPWWLLLLLLLLLAALLFLLAKRKKSQPAPVAEPKPVPVAEPVIVAAAPSYHTVNKNIEDEIRFHAYELWLWRNGQSEDRYDDWCRSVCEVCARYEADGYQSYMEDGTWWVKKTFRT
jgi:hypothetical protein